MKYEKCGAELQEGMKFCPNCGEKVVIKQNKSCTNCGRELSKDDTF